MQEILRKQEEVGEMAVWREMSINPKGFQDFGRMIRPAPLSFSNPHRGSRIARIQV
jgi:hypothetical protein